MDATHHQLLLLQQALATANLTFGPCLPAADLAAFEQAHQVSLPPEYQLFLTHIGNGGAGPPVYGLRPLGASESWWDDEQRAAWQHFQALGRPFPFAQPWCWEGESAPGPPGRRVRRQPVPGHRRLRSRLGPAGDGPAARLRLAVFGSRYRALPAGPHVFSVVQRVAGVQVVARCEGGSPTSLRKRGH